MKNKSLTFSRSVKTFGIFLLLLVFTTSCTSPSRLTKQKEYERIAKEGTYKEKLNMLCEAFAQCEDSLALARCLETTTSTIVQVRYGIIAPKKEFKSKLDEVSSYYSSNFDTKWSLWYNWGGCLEYRRVQAQYDSDWIGYETYCNWHLFSPTSYWIVCILTLGIVPTIWAITRIPYWFM